jgi:hypothetical protein
MLPITNDQIDRSIQAKTTVTINPKPYDPTSIIVVLAIPKLRSAIAMFVDPNPAITADTPTTGSSWARMASP